MTLHDVRDEVDGLATEVSSVAADLVSLLRKERELAMAEMEEQKRLAVRTAGFGIAGFELAVITCIVAGLTLVFVLATFLPQWVAALIVTLLFGGIAAFAAMTAKNAAGGITVLPTRFFKSIGEDFRWARGLMASSLK
jgi:hypothetical protein